MTQTKKNSKKHIHKLTTQKNNKNTKSKKLKTEQQQKQALTNKIQIAIQLKINTQKSEIMKQQKTKNNKLQK